MNKNVMPTKTTSLSFLKKVLQIICAICVVDTGLPSQSVSPKTEEHDVTAVRRPMEWGKWTQHFEVKCTRFEDREIYHSPTNPGHTCWVSLWPVPGGRDVMMSFDQITGPVDHAKPDARSRRVWYERMGKERGQWFIDHGYDATGLTMEVLTFRSSDLGQNWHQVGSYPYPGTLGVLDDPQSVMLPDGSIVRTRYGSLIDDPELPPDAALVQRSEDGGKTWTKPVPMLDRERYFSHPIRPYLMRDGRVAAVVVYYLKTHPGETARRIQWTSVGLLLSGDAGKTWSRDPLVIVKNDGGFRPADEPAMVELPNGDLFFIHRIYGFLIRADESTSYQANRRQSIMWKDLDTFHPGPVRDTPIPHGAKPDIIYLKEDLILYSGSGGFWWTADEGKNWQRLELPAGTQTPALYQPEALQLADGSVLCVRHIGGDDAYGKVNQSIRACRLTLEKTTRVRQEGAGEGEAVAIYGRVEESDAAVEASLQVPVGGQSAGLLVRASPGPAGHPKSVQGYLLKITSGSVSLIRREAGPKEVVLASSPLSRPGGSAASRRFRLKVEGSRLTASVDGQLLLSAEDDTLPYGAVGLYTQDSEVEFVDPKITARRF